MYFNIFFCTFLLNLVIRLRLRCLRMLETEVPAIVEMVVQLLQPHVKKLKPACKGAEILKKKVSAAAKQLKTADSGD